MKDSGAVESLMKAVTAANKDMVRTSAHRALFQDSEAVQLFAADGSGADMVRDIKSVAPSFSAP